MKLVRCTARRALRRDRRPAPRQPELRPVVRRRADARTTAACLCPAWLRHGFLTLDRRHRGALPGQRRLCAGAGARPALRRPRLGIAWPAAPAEVSAKDAAGPPSTRPSTAPSGCGHLVQRQARHDHRRQVLRARAAEGRPVRVGMIGAGFMARGIANQIVNSVPGMRLAAIANRTPSRAERATATRASATRRRRQPRRALERACAPARRRHRGPAAALRGGGLDCLLDVTGAVEYRRAGHARAIDTASTSSP